MIGNDIVIKNACVITGTGRVYPDGFIHIKGSKIIGLGGSSAPGASTVIDAHGAYVLPGFVNSHTHLYSGLARGIEVGRMRKFGEVLKGLWWKLDRALTLEDIYVSAMIGGIEAVKAGVTTVFDHHASYGAISGSLGAVSEALSAIGLRASTCFELSDRCGLSARDEAVAETGLYLESLKNQSIEDPEFLFRGMVGLHASMTLSDDTLNDARELMDIFGVGAHVHVAEGLEDVVATKKKFRMTPVERFVRAGILRKGSLAVHCVHVTKNDIATLKKCGVTVVHNPLSNLNNAVGVSPVLAMAKRGVPFIIGTDGMSLGVADDLKLASVLHKSAACDAQAAWSEMRDAVWQTAPAFVSKMFGYEVGVLKKGAAADIVIIDCSPPTPVTKDNAFGHFMFGVLNSRVRTTIVAGKILMRDFEVMGVDEAVLAKVARALAKKLWQRI